MEQILSCLRYYFDEFTSSLDITKIPEWLTYNSNQPLLFSSSLFFILFLIFLLVYRILKHAKHARILFVSLFSLYFYYKCGGWYFLLLLAMVTSDFLIGRALTQESDKVKKKRWVTLSVCIDLMVLAFFKYFNFIGDALFNIASGVGYYLGSSSIEAISWRPVSIFLPVGISFFTFQSLSYIVDLYRGEVKAVTRWVDYLFYISFFPQLVAGPIVRAKDFLPQMNRTPHLSRGNLGRGMVLVMVGLFKKAIISDYISVNFVDRVFDAPQLYSGVENLLAAYGYMLQVYCDFSGYSDMAIGLALFLGFRFRKNFDVPFNAATITEFWRRWHISLSTWLKDYLYIPLGGNRKGKFRSYINLLITMLLGGLWHGAAWQFILWGGMHGVALVLHKLFMRLFPKAKPTGHNMKWGWRLLGVVLTFNFVVFTFIFFRAKDMQTAVALLRAIATNFHPEVFGQFVLGYRMVFALIVLGYVLHFLPRKFVRATNRTIVRSPLLVQLFLFVVLLFTVFQFKSADVQPFIYFQF